MARKRLIITDGTGTREVPLTGTISVGRDPSCEITSHDPAISRHHAEFLDTSRGLVVRDLRSQNGIRVNDVAVREALLQPGDIVTIAAMSLRYVEEASAPSVATLPPPPDASAGQLAAPSNVPAARVPRAAGLPLSADDSPNDDATRMAAPPVPLPPPAPVAAYAAVPVPPPAAVAADVAVPAPAADSTMAMPLPSAVAADVAVPALAADSTMAMPLPVAPAAAVSSVRAAAPPLSPARQVPSRPAPDRAAAKAAKAPASTRSSWSARVLVRVLLLSVIVSLLSAVPLMVWHQQQMNAVTVSRATALANMLAAGAELALTLGQDLDRATNEVLGQPGVVAARIVALDGRVMAPATRSAEVIAAVPGVNEAPADILRARADWNGDRLEVVRPVAAKGVPRAALAWVTMTPSTEFNGSSLIVTAPVVVIALLLGWVIAALFITGPTERGFATLNQEVELALHGGADAVRDPIGAAPISDLTNTINYLLTRFHGQAADAQLVPAAPAPIATAVPSQPWRTASPPGPASGAAPASKAASTSASASVAAAVAGAAAAAAAGAAAAAPRVEARLQVDPDFHVIEASPGCAVLLGTPPASLIGRHLLDAIADRPLADAVLGCLSALPPAGTEQAIARDGTGRRLTASVSRTGKDGAITIIVCSAESPV